MPAPSVTWLDVLVALAPGTAAERHLADLLLPCSTAVQTSLCVCCSRAGGLLFTLNVKLGAVILVSMWQQTAVTPSGTQQKQA